MCRPGCKGRADLTSSPPSSQLTLAVSPESSALTVSNWRWGLRSLWHLSRHLTARADDNHAAPRGRLLLEGQFPGRSTRVQTRVRFLAYHRIKPHVPPLVRAPVNSFEFHRCLFDTHAFVPQCQSWLGKLPSQSGFCVISMHFTATPRVPPTSIILKPRGFNGDSMVEPRTFTTD